MFFNYPSTDSVFIYCHLEYSNKGNTTIKSIHADYLNSSKSTNYSGVIRELSILYNIVSGYILYQYLCINLV